MTLPPALEASWSQALGASAPIDATVRPSLVRPSLPSAPTLAAPRPAGPPKLGLELHGERRAGDATDLEILGTIGKGGMSTVLLARQPSLRREVALKAALPGDASSAAAILAEGVTMGRLEHPGIVPVHALGVDAAGCPAIVMKRVVGVTWHVLLHDPSHDGWRGWAGSPDDRLPGHLQILTAICNALDFAHSRGIVHRDVKPANVLIGAFGDVYLADWGIAAEMGARGEGVCGTPGYLAPEMALGEAIDARTDVYLLAACLHELLTGSPRHDAPSALAAVARSIESASFEYGDDVPFELAELVNRGCHRDPDERPASVAEFREALADYERHRESVALGVEARERIARLEEAARAPEPSERQRADVDRLHAQVSFALERALAAWPDNPIAQRTATRLEQVLADRRQRAARLEGEARDQDPSLESGLRATVLVGFAIFIAALTGISLWPDRPSLGPRVDGVLFPLALWGIAVATVFALRRHVLRTRFNRNASATALLIVTFIPIERAVGAVAEIPGWAHYGMEAFFMAGVMAVYGITQRRWALWPSAICFLSGVGSVLFPEHLVFTFLTLIPAATLLAAALAWRDRARTVDEL